MNLHTASLRSTAKWGLLQCVDGKLESVMSFVNDGMRVFRVYLHCSKSGKAEAFFHLVLVY